MFYVREKQMISIAMAAYNGEKYIREQLDSILAQTRQDFEMVICDDLSTDDTWKIINEYAGKDGRIRVYQNEKRLGYIKNFERAVGLCSGDCIALSDQDDIWNNDHLEVLCDGIGTFSLVCSDALMVDEQNVSLNMSFQKDILHINEVPKDQELIFTRLLYMNFAQGTSMMFRRELLSTALPFPEQIPHDYWLAVAAAAGSGITYIDRVTLRYRQHGHNVTEKKAIPNLASIFVRKDYHQMELLAATKARLNLNETKSGILNDVYRVYTGKRLSLSGVLRVYKIYRKINWNRSAALLVYRIFRFLFINK
jgi:glycosyltransferase involved in cell wall biosynthesis